MKREIFFLNQKEIVRYWPAAAILLVFIASLLWEWKKNVPEAPPVTRTTFAMDTVIQYCLYGPSAEKTVAACEELLSRLEEQLTCTDSPDISESGDVRRLNRGAGKEPVEVSESVMQLLLRSQELSRWTGGLFDITVGPLTRLWNVTGENPTVPPQEEVEQALSLVGDGLVLEPEGQTAFLQREGQRIDLGAVAKGYACGFLREICEENGVTRGYISLGGNMMVLPDSAEMRFGLQNPLRGGEASVIASLSLEGQTMATAGGYERYFEQDGVRYCHILDPRTGWPAQTDLLSASVISEDGALADALSTALFLMGREEALAFLKDSDCRAVLVDSDCRVWLAGDVEESFHFQLMEPSGFLLAGSD